MSLAAVEGREAFYACKPYADIYEEAFGKPLSFKDPERVKLCERLDRWIEKDLSKTAKGDSTPFSLTGLKPPPCGRFHGICSRTPRGSANPAPSGS